MVVHHNVKGYDEFTKLVEQLEGSGERIIHVLFSGGKNENGESWCPYCVKAEPVIHDALEKAPEKSHFVHVDVGEHLRKLIKYEERMGVNNQQNDYFESLFRRTTASYRAKTDQENNHRSSHKKTSLDTYKPSGSKPRVENRKILGERNREGVSTSSHDILDDTPKRKSVGRNKPSGSKSSVETRKILRERNFGEISTSTFDSLDDTLKETSLWCKTSKNKQNTENRNNRGTLNSTHDLLDSTHNSSNQARSTSNNGQNKNKFKEAKTNTDSIRNLIEQTLTQILHEKYSQEFKENPYNENQDREKTPLKAVVEDVLKEKLRDLRRPSSERLNTSESGSLRFIIEDIVTHILQKKLVGHDKESPKSKDLNKDIQNISQELQQKLSTGVDKESSKSPKSPKMGIQNLNRGLQNDMPPREPVIHYEPQKTLDSQELVDELLGVKKANNKVSNKNTSKSKYNNNSVSSGAIKRLQRSPRKKPEWQDPRPEDKALDKPLRPLRSRSPAAISTARTARSKASSVLIPRSVSQGRTHKPHTDPVALYQYYKNEWEHFRKQIPGESPHNSLRWQVRHRFLDPE